MVLSIYLFLMSDVSKMKNNLKLFDSNLFSLSFLLNAM